MRSRPWFSAALLFSVGVLLAQSFALSPASRMAPLWVLVPTIALLLVQLLLDAIPPLGRRLSLLQEGAVAPGSEGARAISEPAPDAGPSRDLGSRELRLVLWLAWLMGLMYLVGFLLSTVLFLLPYLRVESGVGWGRSVVLTGVATAVVYLVFGVVARVPFPPGILF